MIDASGRLIRGATHPYVLADDLYPIVLTQCSLNFYHRVGSPAGQWTADWVNFGNCWDACYWRGEWSEQSAWSLVIGTNTIDWARVKKITWGTLYLYVDILTGLTVKLTKSKNNSTLPAGKVIRDDWDTVAEYTETNYAPINIEWDINGVEPTSLEYALMFTADEYWNDDLMISHVFYETPVQARIVYNLAT